MSSDVYTTHDMLARKHFWREIEDGIRIANREIIHTQVPVLTRDDILAVAISVARLRARYLQAALAVADNGEAERRLLEDLRGHRELFDESKNAFDALCDAIDKGYVDVSGYPQSKE